MQRQQLRLDRTSLMVIVILVAVLTSIESGGAAHAQEIATSQPANTILIPGTATLAPTESVNFYRPEAPDFTRLGRISARVSNQSDQTVTVQYDGQELVVTASPGFSARVESAVPNGVPGTLGPCSSDLTMPNVVRCRLIGTPMTADVFVSQVVPVGRTETVPLSEGCNNVSLTWPAGTEPREVARSVTPQSALIAIWRYDATEAEFLGWSPLVNAPNDFTTVGHLDAVFVCMRESGILTRPVV